MNRRELAKNGFLSLCGFMLAKILPKKPKENIRIAFKGPTNDQSISLRFYASDEEGNMREINASTLAIPDDKTVWC